MNNTAKKSILSVAALTLTASLSANVAAGTMDETFVHGSQLAARTVTYDPAELSSKAGRERLKHRIEAAAESICGPAQYRLAGSVSRMSKNRACIDQAVENALAKVGTGSVASID